MRTNPNQNPVAQIRAEYAACPNVEDPDTVAAEAQADAMDLAMDVRELDPRQVWGRLNLWLMTDPLRLMAVAWAAAAMVPVDQPVGVLLSWTDAVGRAS